MYDLVERFLLSARSLLHDLNRTTFKDASLKSPGVYLSIRKVDHMKDVCHSGKGLHDKQVFRLLRYSRDMKPF